MSATNTAVTSATTSPYNTSEFWERVWRVSGLGFLALIVIAYFIYGNQPHIGASADTLAEFFEGHRTRILIAAVLSGMAMLNLMWFAAALRTVLADAGRDGWGAAATASSAVLGGMFLPLIATSAALAYSIAGSGDDAFTGQLNDLMWAAVVLTSFPRAMLVMSSAFGLWRAGLISNALFTAGVAVVVLVVLGGTTWMSDGFWAPDGVYSRFISPIASIAWLIVVSRIVLTRAPATRAGW